MKFIICIIAIMLTACSSGFTIPHNNMLNHNDAIIRAQAFVTIDHGNILTEQSTTRGSASVPVAVTVASNVSFSVNVTDFAVPSNTTTDTLSFGSISVSSLRDNSLKQCGSGNNQQCTQAALRIYTIGSGGGLWNSTDGYGTPFYAQLGSNPVQLIGLTSVNAAIMQTLSIANNKHVINLSDFSPSPLYNFTADFSNGGAGNYSTTLVIEYVLQ